MKKKSLTRPLSIISELLEAKVVSAAPEDKLSAKKRLSIADALDAAADRLEAATKPTPAQINKGQKVAEDPLAQTVYLNIDGIVWAWDGRHTINQGSLEDFMQKMKSGHYSSRIKLTASASRSHVVKSSFGMLPDNIFDAPQPKSVIDPFPGQLPGTARRAVFAIVQKARNGQGRDAEKQMTNGFAMSKRGDHEGAVQHIARLMSKYGMTKAAKDLREALERSPQKADMLVKRMRKTWLSAAAGLKEGDRVQVKEDAERDRNRTGVVVKESDFKTGDTMHMEWDGRIPVRWDSDGTVAAVPKSVLKTLPKLKLEEPTLEWEGKDD